MIHIQGIAYVRFAVADIVRSRRFYEELLSLRPDDEAVDVDQLGYRVGSSALSFVRKERAGGSALGGPMVALEVRDFDEAVSGFVSAGVPFQEIFSLDRQGRRQAVLVDPDGHCLMVSGRSRPRFKASRLPWGIRW